MFLTVLLILSDYEYIANVGSAQKEKAPVQMMTGASVREGSAIINAKT